MAKSTTSASSSLPSSNLSPFSVKLVICALFLILIFPSMIIWHAPTSATALHQHGAQRGTGAGGEAHRGSTRPRA